MAYKALYRTHRPMTFEQVVGQMHITNTLQNIIRKDKVSHAYLFSGPRGTGKTSVAHVFARTLNCSDLADITRPCKDCEQCLSNPSLDIVEIDAASNNGVADIRNLIDNAKYAPSISKYKVYIIDEVHMLSKGAFNALLKTLEEPPKHVVFILATTEPHKIPITILSRTQKFNFRRIPEDIIASQLTKILNKEEIEFDDEAIKMISKISNGGMRDALSIADQASAYSNGNISFNAISQVFGIISTQNQIKLLSLAYNKKTKELLSLATEFVDNGGDIERITGTLIDILKDFIVYSKTRDDSLITLLSLEEVTNLEISISFAYDVIDMLMKLLSNLRLCEVPRQAFELLLLKTTEIREGNSFVETTKLKSEEVEPMIEDSIQKKYEEMLKANKEKIEEVKNTVEKTKEFVIPKIVDEDVTNEFVDSIEVPIPSNEDPLMLEPDENTIEFPIPEKQEIFSTQEIKRKSEEIFSDEKLEQLQKEIESTKEFEISKKLIEEQDVEHLLSKIDAKNNRFQQKSNEASKFATPREVDVMGMFAMGSEDLVAQDKIIQKLQFSMEEIINLLVQANRTILTQTKKDWDGILAYSSNSKYGTYANLLESTKIISAGEDFILLSSNENIVISQINSVRKDREFIELLNKLLNKPKLVFAITRDEFESVKQKWKELSKANNIPKPRMIEKIKIEEKEMSEAEGFGTSIFGALFDS